MLKIQHQVIYVLQFAFAFSRDWQRSPSLVPVVQTAAVWFFTGADRQLYSHQPLLLSDFSMLSSDLILKITVKLLAESL